MAELNILVMIKQVPDPSRNRRMTAGGSIDREKTPAVMNQNCKHAVEEALRVKDEHPAMITVMSMGPPKAEIALREAIAMGCDAAYLLTDRKLAGSDTWATAYALSMAVEKFSKEHGKFDLIFCGMQTTDGDTAHVGPQLSERLDIPLVAYGEEVTYDEKDGSLHVRRIIEGGYELMRVKRLPALVTVPGTHNVPRKPTLHGVVRSKRAAVTLWTVEDVQADEDKVGLAGSPTIVYQVKKVEYTRPPCKVLRGEPQEIVDQLFQEMEKDGKLGVWTDAA